MGAGSDAGLAADPAVGTTPTATITRFGYAGQYTDPTGLIYLRARYYDPTSAQFLTIDPLQATTYNPYGCTGGNPLQFTDPSGLDWYNPMSWDQGTLETFSNGVAAFGDTITFGGTKAIRDLIDYQAGYTDTVDYCSTAYSWGQATGVAAMLALPGLGGGEAAARIPATAGRVLETGAAESGGAASVRLGQAGEAAVRGAYDIGPKATAEIGERTRIFDGLNSEAVSEVKNVARQSLTQQLRDDITYARDNGLRFDLYVRPSTELSRPLVAADLDPLDPFNIGYIP